MAFIGVIVGILGAGVFTKIKNFKNYGYQKKYKTQRWKEKKILLRVDFNAAIEEDTVKEKFKIKAADETVRYLLV